METKNESKSKIIIYILAAVLLVSVIVNIKLISDVNSANSTIKTTLTEKEQLVKDLEELKATYDVAISDNTTISDDLKAERAKVEKLLKDLKSSKGEVSKFKAEIESLQTKMKDLMEVNEKLKKENVVLTLERDSTIVVLGESKKANEALSEKVEKGSKLSILNMQAAAFKLKKSGKIVSTDKASKANTLRISFLIAENAIAKSEDKEYYIQVIDGKKNVLGESKTVYFGQKELIYSFITTVKYENKTVQVTEDLHGEDFAKGIYTVNVFDKENLITSSSFTLR